METDIEHVHRLMDTGWGEKEEHRMCGDSNIHYHMQNRQPMGIYCMTQETQNQDSVTT